MSGSITEVGIIGSGPYGLSLAAQLRAAGVPVRIWGPPMRTWREAMPAGMHLKSDGFASDLYDAERRHTLKAYCAERGIAYDDLKIPVALETFAAYGLAFQAALVPNLEKQQVVGLTRTAAGFEVRLESGEVARVRRVVIATGVSYLDRTPPELAALGPDLCTHSAAHHDLSVFKGKRVVIVGGGSSALDLAALLREAGAAPRLVARHAVLFSTGPSDQPPSLWQRIRHPHLGLGSSFRSAVYTVFPNLFHYLPRSLRLRIVRRHLGPFGGWFIRPRVEGVVPVHEYCTLQAATVVDRTVHLKFADARGGSVDLQADHVIAATGYKPSVARLSFIHAGLRAAIETEPEAESPRLSARFESSVPGLYFMGLLAANSFGPLLRFALGADFCAGRLADHLTRVCARGPAGSLEVAPSRAAD